MERFHFNELLLSPFQMLLCLELSASETQDQIVCVMSELVQSYADQIRSGWKPLFGVLKLVRSVSGVYGSLYVFPYHFSFVLHFPFFLHL